MRLLVHICCGPCSIMVLRRLMDAGHALTGLFFNPNIQPVSEYLRRREGAAKTAARLGVPLVFADTLPLEEQRWTDPWLTRAVLSNEGVSASRPEKDSARPAAELPPAADPLPWLRAVAGREQERCLFCLRLRLRKTAELAHGGSLGGSFDGFTSTLLYSRYQPHDGIKALGMEIAEAHDLVFAYEDFRTSWGEGVSLSKEWGVYRQQYCGCLFSEYERYSRDFAQVRSQE